MPRRLLVLSVALGLVSLFFAVGIVRTLLVRHPLPRPTTPRAVAPAPPMVTAAASDPSAEAYAAIAAQNLFNPGRSETASSTAATVAVVKPILHGVVIEGAKSRAFLEDPSVKRVGGYSVGDSVGGGKIQKIADDRVVIARPEGMVEVMLQDPSKPRPVAPAGPAVTVPGQPVPGQPVPGQPFPAPGQAAPVPVQPAPLVQAPPPPPSAPPAQQPAIPSQNRRRPPSGQGND
jgi:hypothetical protein